MKASLTRTYQLEAAHHLPLTHENHKCHRMHGHTWIVDVCVQGPIDPETGWVVDFGKLDDIWAGQIHRFADHQILNDVVGNPTSEVVARWIFARLKLALEQLVTAKEVPAGVSLKHVVVRENPQSACHYEGEIE